MKRLATQPAPPTETQPELWQQAPWQKSVSKAALSWFRRNRRDLPWRESGDPYRIWVSEIMLQQTQVATVIPYFHRFLAAFPTVEHLAAADTSEVLKLWEGLGYYRRARQLHAAAQKLVADHGGQFPRSFEAVRGLPGIGRYTAGAILSIAYQQRLPILEANTVRLFSRLIGLRTPPAQSASQRILWQVAEALLPQRNAGDFNQAAMEIGALVCTPRSPLCTSCPLASDCVAFAQGLQEVIPGQVKKMNYEDVTEHAVAIQDRRKRIWLRCRTAAERWTGLWDFPRFDPEDSGEQLAKELCFSIKLGNPLATIRHGVTRFRITLHLHQADLVGSVSRARGGGQWYSLAQIKELPLTTPARKLCRFFG